MEQLGPGNTKYDVTLYSRENLIMILTSLPFTIPRVLVNLILFIVNFAMKLVIWTIIYSGHTCLRALGVNVEMTLRIVFITVMSVHLWFRWPVPRGKYKSIRERPFNLNGGGGGGGVSYVFCLFFFYKYSDSQCCCKLNGRSLIRFNMPHGKLCWHFILANNLIMKVHMYMNKNWPSLLIMAH
jgi:hypothetical protein